MPSPTVDSITKRYPQLQFVNTDTEVMAIFESIGKPNLFDTYQSCFVLVGNAEYLAVWAMRGIVPYLERTVTNVYRIPNFREVWKRQKNYIY